MALCSIGCQTTWSRDHGSRRARRCGASCPGIEPFCPWVGSLCWVWERPVSRCPMFLANSKPSSLPASGVKRSLIIWCPFSPFLPAALQTFLVCLGTTALPRASAALQAPGACGRSWAAATLPGSSCAIVAFCCILGWPFVPGETVLMFLALCHPAPTPFTFGSKRRCGTGGPGPS